MTEILEGLLIVALMISFGFLFAIGIFIAAWLVNVRLLITWKAPGEIVLRRKE